MSGRPAGRGAAVAAAAYLVALGYYVLAPQLPRIPGDAGFLLPAAVGLLAGAGCVLATLPLREDWRVLAGTLALGAAGGLALTAADALEAANAFKLLFAASAGFLLARAIWSPLVAYAVAAVVFVVDIASVAAGPTRYLVEEQPRAVDFLTLWMPWWGRDGGSQLGISDMLFLAAFLYVTWRFGLRRGITAAALVASFIGSLLLAYWLNRAVPALPLLALALVAPNLDIAVRQVRGAIDSRA